MCNNEGMYRYIQGKKTSKTYTKVFSAVVNSDGPGGEGKAGAFLFLSLSSFLLDLLQNLFSSVAHIL